MRTPANLRTVLLLAACGLVPLAVAEEPAVEMQIDRIATATPDQMREMADEGAKTIVAAQAVIEKLEQGRAKGQSKGEGEGLDCVVDNLTSVRLLKTQADNAKASMETALTEARLSRAASELRKIAVAANQSENLKTDAERCALGVTSSAGTSKTTASGGVGDPDDDVAPPGGDPLDFTSDGATKSPL